MAQSHRKQVAALSELSDIVVKISDKHWPQEIFTCAKSVSGVKGPGLGVRSPWQWGGRSRWSPLKSG